MSYLRRAAIVVCDKSLIKYVYTMYDKSIKLTWLERIKELKVKCIRDLLFFHKLVGFGNKQTELMLLFCWPLVQHRFPQEAEIL